MTEQPELKQKMALAKAVLVYLNKDVDFPAWHIALRSLVSQFSMSQNLLYSVSRYDLAEPPEPVHKHNLHALFEPASATLYSEPEAAMWAPDAPQEELADEGDAEDQGQATPPAARAREHAAASPTSTTTTTSSSSSNTAAPQAGAVPTEEEVKAERLRINQQLEQQQQQQQQPQPPPQQPARVLFPTPPKLKLRSAHLNGPTPDAFDDSDYDEQADDAHQREHLPTTAHERQMMTALGVSRTQDEFFASSVTFYKCRTSLPETKMETYYRHEIWNWMQKTLAKGEFAWIASTIVPVFDIRRYYLQICEAANKPTAISHAMEFKKCFELQPDGNIFQYHANLIEHIRMLAAQGEEIGIDAHFPKWMQQALLLIAAYKLPQYRDMVVKYTVKGRVVGTSALLHELAKYRAVRGHFKQTADTASTTATVKEALADDNEVSVLTTTAPTRSTKPCFAFQKGTCKKGNACSYTHSQAATAKPPYKPANKTATAPSQSQQCKRCGEPGPHSTCSFQGSCNYCHKKGHKESVCRSKRSGAKPTPAGQASIVLTVRAEVDDENTNVKHSSLLPIASVLVAEGMTQHKTDADVPRANSSRWCVDSGANRHLCRELGLFRGKQVPKTIRIGEARAGHTFDSNAEGPITLHAGGKPLPLLSNVIYADAITDNIMSVPEAVDAGYTVIFDRDEVNLYRAGTVEVKDAPILKGQRDSRTHLFFMNFPFTVSSATKRSQDLQTSNPPSRLINDTTSTAHSESVLPASCNILVNLVRTCANTREAGATSSNFTELHRRRSRGEEDITEPCDMVRAFLARTYHEYKNDYDLWHPRLSHVNPRLAQVAKPDLKNWPRKNHCDDCVKGKLHKFAHSGKRPSAAELPWAPGEYLTCDLLGPLLRSMGGAKYAAFYVDLKSRFVYVRPLKAKTDHYTAFVEVICDLRARSGRQLRFFKTDGDGIFTGRQAQAIYLQYGIKHVSSAPGDSASNDIAERAIRTFTELARTSLLHANAPPSFWAEAMHSVAYVWNRIAVMPDVTKPGTHLSRLAILEGHTRLYDLDVLRAFGTKCHYLLTLQKKSGLKMAVQTKGELGAIMGIEDDMAAYRVWNFRKRKLCNIPFSQVVTHEGHYPFKDYKLWGDEDKELPISFAPVDGEGLEEDEWDKYKYTDEENAYLLPPCKRLFPEDVAPVLRSPTITHVPDAVEAPQPEPDGEAAAHASSEPAPVVPPMPPPPSPVAVVAEPPTEAPEISRYSLRTRTVASYAPPPQMYRQPLLRQLLECDDPYGDLAPLSILAYRVTEPYSQAKTPLNIIPDDPSTKPTTIPAPRNRKEARASPWWQGYYKAELAEMESHARNGTWQLVPMSEVPADATVLRDRWAYSDKLGPEGDLEKFKARLTAMGCQQREGKDFTDTYASVMSTRTFRMLLQIYNSEATNKMHHWDVSTAFVHAPLNEKVFMKQASGHEIPGKEDHVYLLVKALYGTKQAAHAWQQHLKKLLAACNCTSLISDPATYVQSQGSAFVMIGTHVDDLFVVHNAEGERLRADVWRQLSDALTIKDLGEASWTLQMTIQRDAALGKLKICQKPFVDEVLQRFKLSDIKECPTPAIDTGAECEMTESDMEMNEQERTRVTALPFYELIGCMWWLAQMTRFSWRCSVLLNG